MPQAININIFLQLQAATKYQRQQLTKIRRQLLNVYIIHNIGFNNKNNYLWMKKIHIVRMMGIILNAKRTINRSLGRPKNLFSFKVRQAICEGRSECVICQFCNKSNMITQPLCCNLNLGIATKARACEGVCRNPTLAKCRGESQHSQSWGLGVLPDSRMFRVRQQGLKHFALRCSWCHWKGLEA